MYVSGTGIMKMVSKIPDSTLKLPLHHAHRTVIHQHSHVQMRWVVYSIIDVVVKVLQECVHIFCSVHHTQLHEEGQHETK